MKKSKFLQSSKDMLSRSFNPAKCKTSLRLAGSRMKLMRNKKEVQLKQMKREISQLLENGQEQTAIIRVEHVIREEKMMAAYDLVQIYCELMVARLPIIESQKNCPIDLKEAIASIVFASPRCGDVPELLDVRKQITAKYGKDFTTAAIELRPACGVSRMLIEKLSAAAPDGPTKIKILSAIAEEHNVKWEHKSFDEKESVPPPYDLPSVPSTFTSGSRPDSSNFNSPDVQIPPSNKVNGSRYTFGSGYAGPSQFDSANVQAPPENNMHDSHFNPSQQDIRTSVGPQNHEPAPSTSPKLKEAPPVPNTGREDWPLEFKDATAAAQAAAESAERASMAARAAAELASGGRITRQHSTESRKSEGHGSRVKTEHLPGEGAYRPSYETSNFEDEEIDSINSNRVRMAGTVGEGRRSGKKAYSQSGSLKSKASMDKDIFNQGVPPVDEFSRNNYSREDSRGREGRLNKQSFKRGAESPKGPEKSESVREESIRKQPSINSSRSHSSVSDEFNPEAESPNGWVEKSESIREERITKQPSVQSSRTRSNVSDDANIFATADPKLGYDADDDPFNKGHFAGEDSASVHFDKFDYDDHDGYDHGDHHRFDVGPSYDEHESEFHLPSPSQKSTGHLSLNRDSWGPIASSKTVDSTASLFFSRNDSSAEFSESVAPVNDSEEDNFKPLTFDDSDGPVSDSDEDINMSKGTSIRDSSDLLSKNNGSGHFNHNRGSSFKAKEYSGFDRERVSLTSDDESKSSYAISPVKSSFKNSSINQPPVGVKDALVEPDDFPEESETDCGEGLKFGKLTGGLRHKGYHRPSYLKHQFGDGASSLKDENTSTTIGSNFQPAVERPNMRKTMDDGASSLKDETTSTTTGSNFRPAVERPNMRKTMDHKNRPEPESDSDSDSSEEEAPSRKKSSQKLETQGRHTRRVVEPKLNLGPSKSIFGSDDSDLDDVPQGRHTRRVVEPKLNLGPSKPIFGSDDSDLDDDVPQKPISGRTQIPGGQSRRTKPSSARPGRSANSKMRESSGALDTDSVDRKPISGTPKEVEPQKERVISEQAPAKPTSKPARSNYWGPPESPYSPKNSVMKQESEPRVTSKVHDTDAIEERKPKTSPPKSPKAATDNKTSSSQDGGTPKASHVHPKLPDYDFLVQALRKNRS